MNSVNSRISMKTSNAYHLKICVSDGRRSKKFYDELFSLLGWKTVYEDADADAAGYSDGNFTLWVVPADHPKMKHSSDSVGFHHFAIRVKDSRFVDKTHEWCKKKGIEVADPPALYPQYAKDYYAAFFLDPDGLKLEVVCNPKAD